MQNKALILVDFQKEWINPVSDDFVGDISAVLERTNKLISFCREKNYKIIFTKHIEKNSIDVWSQKSEGTQIIDMIEKQDSDTIIIKNKVSPFFQTLLEQELAGTNEIVVCGILTNMCVRSTIQDAYDRDFDITVIKDCCVSFNKKTQEFTFEDLKATREEIKFINTLEFIKSV